MEYVSATIEACKVVTAPLMRSVGNTNYGGSPRDCYMGGSYLKPFDVLEVKMDEEGHRILPAFRAVVRVNILGTEDGKSDSPVDRGDTLMFRLNLTHYTKEPENRLTEAVGMFEVNLDPKEADLCIACVNFLDIVRTADIPSMILPKDADGEYVLKLLVRRKKSPDEQLKDFLIGEHDFVVRSMAKLHLWTREELEDERKKPDCRVEFEDVAVTQVDMDLPLLV